MIFALLVLMAVMLFWGLLLGGAVLLCGDKEGAKNLLGTGVGLATLAPIFFLVGALLMALMI